MTRRQLTRRQRLRVFDDAHGICHLCGLKIRAGLGQPWDVSHVIPLEIGGADEPTNMKPAHRACHQKHTAETDLPLIAKTHRQRQKHLGIRKTPSLSHPRLRRKMDGTVVHRDSGEPA